jgi:hypothetical protein
MLRQLFSDEVLFFFSETLPAGQFKIAEVLTMVNDGLYAGILDQLTAVKCPFLKLKETYKSVQGIFFYKEIKLYYLFSISLSNSADIIVSQFVHSAKLNFI